MFYTPFTFLLGLERLIMEVLSSYVPLFQAQKPCVSFFFYPAKGNNPSLNVHFERRIPDGWEISGPRLGWIKGEI